MHAIFARPMPQDLDRAAVFGALEAAGADVAPGRCGQVVVRMNDYMHAFKARPACLAEEEVKAIWKLLVLADLIPARDCPL